MKTLSYTLSLTLLIPTIFFFGCQPVDIPITSLTITTPSTSFATFEPEKKAKKKPRFSYKGQHKRDPFVSLTNEGSYASKDEIIVPRISALELHGIMKSENNAIALLVAGGHSYFLKDNRLYDSKQRAIRGIKGKIKKESVFMRSSDGTRKEIFLRAQKK